MKKETIKSIILTVLIITSFLLTWNTWTYQPATREKTDTKLYESIPITNETREFHEVVRPQQLFIHEGDKHYSTLNGTYMNSTWKKMQEWEYSNLKKEEQTFPNEQSFQTWLNGIKEKIELRFFSEIPMFTFQSMLKWEAEITGNLSFDSILLQLDRGSEIQKVYFVSYDKMSVLESSVNNENASNFIEGLFNNKGEFQEYFSIQIGNGKSLYLPEKEVTVEKYQYLTEEVEGRKFRDALFTNPSIVKQDYNRYTDSVRLLDISLSNQTVEYVNTTVRNSNSLIASSLIDKSIVSLNSHGGWTNDFGLFHVNEEEQETTFIMMIKSMPVINSARKPFGPTTISQVWGENELAKYYRPLYELVDNGFQNNSSTLMSGRSVQEMIIGENAKYDMLQIENIFIGYELSNSGNYVNAEPVWCLKMDNGETTIIYEEDKVTGGNANGME
ncbi:YycH family regulatory protein [Metabacillus malikii]|uniref:Regulatory protein YycH of two-component signal transduction system YycFG n=1 Tax=Metabacillus malikii TaxID=1504265 RepID=A0ABT9ZG14_9BACI|nr:two-component system activity regulator YycH [Metabacillus malikii]MDQ0230925.1 regulatory protein YycH of two-component signal transduction system YycFG [Metabacillus malikii]